MTCETFCSPQGHAWQRHPRHRTSQHQRCHARPSPQRQETGSSSSDLEPTFRAPRARGGRGGGGIFILHREKHKETIQVNKAIKYEQISWKQWKYRGWFEKGRKTVGLLNTHTHRVEKHQHNFCFLSPRQLGPGNNPSWSSTSDWVNESLAYRRKITQLLVIWLDSRSRFSDYLPGTNWIGVKKRFEKTQLAFMIPAR